MKKLIAIMLGATALSAAAQFEAGQMPQLRPLNAQLPALGQAAVGTADFGALGFKELPQSRNLRRAVTAETQSLTLSPARAQQRAVSRPGAKPVQAILMYTDEWADQASALPGIYSIATDGSYTAPVEVKQHGIFTAPAFATAAGNQFYYGQQAKSYSTVTAVNVYSFNLPAWTENTVLKGDINTKDFIASDAAYNPVNTEVYGSVYCISREEWGIYRIAMDGKLVFRKLVSLDKPLVALDFDTDGTLYAVTADGRFVTYDLLTRKETVIATGLPVSTLTTTGTIDAERRCMYYASCTEQASALHEVMLSDGACTKLLDFGHGEQFMGMYQPTEAPAQAVTPGAASGLTLSFTTNSLEGTVAFTAPTVTSDGRPAEGNIAYTLMAGNIKLASDSVAYGTPVTVPATLPASGDYTFTVRFSNAAGTGPVAKISKWIGNDIPKPIMTAPKAVYANGKATITWSSPSTLAGVNDGYVNGSKFTYTVVREHDGKVIADKISTRTAVDEFEEPTDLTLYYYNVYANYEGNQSTPVKSAGLCLGAATPPYALSCATDPSAYFTIIDTNKDYRQWGWSSVYKRMQIAPSTTVATDDWLITMPYRLEAGRAYRLSFETYSGAANTTQKMEVKMGTGATAADMTTSLSNGVMEITSVEKTPTLVEYNITVPQTGNYRIGFHGVADKGLSTSAYLCLRNIEMGAGVVMDAPAAVTALTAVPDVDGALKADVQLTAPDKTFSGDALTALTAVELRVADKVLKRFDNPAPGAVLSATVEFETEGLTTITAVAITDKGESQPTSTETFVGLSTPQSPQPTAYREVSNGEIYVAWNSVSKDIYNKNLPAGSVTYALMSLDQTAMKWGTLRDNLTGNSLTTRVAEADARQDFFTLAMAAKNSKGLSKYWALPQLPLGAPYMLPYIESNANNDLSHTFLTKKYAGEGLLVWKQANLSTIQGVVPSDNDGGYFYLQGSAKGDKAGLISGKISLENAVRPVLSVDYVVASNSHNKMGFNVIVDGDEQLLKEWDCNGPKTAWASMHIPMDKYIGKQIQLVLWGELVDMALVCADRMELIDYPAKDMAVTAVKAPEKMRPGRTADITVAVANTGLAQVDSYTLSLLANGVQVAQKEVTTPLAFRTAAQETFSYTASSVNSGAVTFTVQATTADDSNADNNSASSAQCTILESLLPAPANFAVTPAADNNSLCLTWDAPNVSNPGLIETEEDCEGLSSFAVTALADWKTVDVDQSKSRAFSGVVIPQLGINSFAFMVFDNDDRQFGAPFAAHSGHKFFMAFANEAGKCDDWLISPALNEKAQTVTMWARSYNPSYPESFEILYSTTGIEVADFKLIQRFEKIPYTFAQYSAVVPAGAKHFAVRCVSEGGNMFILDDIVYQPAMSDLRVNGYNVYRNGVNVAPVAASAQTWADTQVPKGSKAYCMTAVYNYGESAPSNTVYTDFSGIDEAGADALSIRGLRGLIAVDGADSVTVVNALGSTVYSATVNGSVRISAAPGIYVVTANGRTAKVAVR